MLNVLEVERIFRQYGLPGSFSSDNILAWLETRLNEREQFWKDLCAARDEIDSLQGDVEDLTEDLRAVETECDQLHKS